MKYEIRRLSFIENFREAFKLYLDNFGPLFLISLICSIPAVLIPGKIDSNASLTQTEQAALMVDAFLWIIIMMAVHTLSTALMIQLIYRKYVKQPQTMGQYIKNLLPFILPIIGLSIVEAVIIGVGFLALVIPGIYFALALSMSSQVLIVERKRVFESIQRSFELTRGFKLEIFGYMLILFLFSLIVVLLTGQFLNVLETVQVGKAAQALIEHLVQVLIAPIGACVFILIYFNLRIDKEGFTLKHLENAGVE